MADQEPDRLARLAQTAADLAREYAEMAEANGDQLVVLARRARSNRRLIWVVAASVLLDILMSVALTVSLVQVVGAEHQIRTLTDRLDTQQTVTRRNSLCPLYTLFKASDTPAARAAAPDKGAYDHAQQVIRDGYTALSCADFVTVPPAPG